MSKRKMVQDELDRVKAEMALDTNAVFYPWKTQYNAHRYVPYAEKVNPVSETVPDMTLSLEEIVARYSRGMPVIGSGMKTPMFDGDDDFFPEMASMDLAEREEYYEELKKEYQEIQQREKQRQKQDAARKAKEAEELAIRTYERMQKVRQGVNEVQEKAQGSGGSAKQ